VDKKPNKADGKYRKLTIGLAISAGLLYNFWVFGYLLDPQALHNTYFSVLESYGRPYSWLFILADVVTSLIVIIVSWLMWRSKTATPNILIVFNLFGLATLLDATIPIADKCSSSISACGIDPSQIFTFHDLASLVAYLSIFYGLSICHRLIRARKLTSAAAKFAQYTYYGWILAGLFLLFSIITNRFTPSSQGLFLAAIGLALIAITNLMLSTGNNTQS
jgi:hypothetical protein